MLNIILKTTLWLLSIQIIALAPLLGNTIYVDDDAPNGGDGASWITAYNDLQTAIDAANAYDEIHVAGGTYLPTKEDQWEPGSVTFYLKDAIVIQGGYAGLGHPDPDLRLIQVYRSVMSGDMNGDDGPGFTNRGDNCNRAIDMFNTGLTAATMLDGFTISGGYNDAEVSFGGGILIINDSPWIVNCTITDNSSLNGGGVGFHQGTPVFINCFITENEAWHDGGGIYTETSGMMLINCTVTNNHSGNPGGGIFTVSPMTIDLYNGIVWGNTHGSNNTPSEIVGDAEVTYSNVRGGFAGTGNINSDPKLLDRGLGTYHLSHNSPCIDAGTGSLPWTLLVDIDLQNRLMDGNNDGAAVVDMGADECTPRPPMVWVNHAWSGYEYGETSGNLTIGINAFTTIQEGIDGVATGGIAYVADGNYKGSGNRDLNFHGRALILTSVSGAEKCVIDCEKSGRGFYFDNNEEPDSIVSGFTVQNGQSDYGGAVLCKSGAPTLMNCIFRDNSVNSSGGAVFSDYRYPTVTECLFINNYAEVLGGALCYLEDGHASEGGMIISSTFRNNTAKHGGGMFCEGYYEIFDCTFMENSAQQGGGLYMDYIMKGVSGCHFLENSANEGGGIYSMRCTLETFTNSTLVSNSAHRGGGVFLGSWSHTKCRNNVYYDNSSINGGAIYLAESAVIQMVNSTVSKNIASQSGGALYLEPYCRFDIANSIVWDNANIGIYTTEFENQKIKHSNIMGGWPGTGNIHADPLFVDPDNGDFHLTRLSPCLNAGTHSVSGLPSTDNEGDPRKADGIVDMGADEFHPHLYITGDFTPGGAVEVKIIGEPGTSTLGLCFGTGVLETPISTQYGPLHMSGPYCIIPLPLMIPVTGVLSMPTQIPATASAASGYPIQAFIGSELSNLFVVEIE